MKNARTLLGEFATCAEYFPLIGSTFLVAFVTMSRILLLTEKSHACRSPGSIGNKK
jgi:hypothetical protein